MKGPVRFFTLALALSLLLLYLFLRGKKVGSGSSTATVTTRPSQIWLKNRPPKITLIAVWSIKGSTPNYVPYFIQSVEANAQVDLLFVQLDKTGLGCPTYSSAANIQELCLTEDQYYKLHVNFLCKRWKCSKDEEGMAFDTIKRNGETDTVNTYFRLLRPGVFAHFMDPDTTIWGWCDVDEFWGNFTRTFPWDVASDFDILAPSAQPEFSNHRMLYTRGHMAFIRNSPEVLEKLHSFPKFSSLSNYLTLPGTRYDAEESEFSHYLFSDEKSFTFLTFEGMSDSYDTTFVSPRGVYYSPLQKEDLDDSEKREYLATLVRPENKKPILPTFSDEGIEEEAHVFEDGKRFDNDVWFDRKYVTFVETGWVEPEKREQKAYFMRRKPYGPITQRLEPRERYVSRHGKLAVDECLYMHWQNEKHTAWFRRIPKRLAPGQIFVQHNRVEADIWNEFGDVVYTTGR